MLIQKSSWQLLRFPFSVFLMPVYWFALSQLVYTNWWRAVLVFIILHVLVYPASNGYNSYMDRDETPVGGIKNPLQPTRQLFLITVVMDVLAVALGFFIDGWFAVGIALYILASRAYSYRGIRLKKYALPGYLTVVVFQGAVMFALVYHGAHATLSTNIPVTGMVASSLLIGGFYPLTQIYQHEADKKDGVTTISAWLGYRGTFIFCAVVYSVAFAVLALNFFLRLEPDRFFVLATCMLPILVYYFVWLAKVWKNPEAASFENTMRMNIIASVCTNIGFIALTIWNNFE
jgi:1,4-dihydroxy-2-naphthoate polyprenyltransferase